MSEPVADGTVTFRDLALSEPVLFALDAVGYESPSPIQGATIPHLLAGRDVLGQAQTGTGKTAAFALPILSQLDAEQRLPQALVLAPTSVCGNWAAECSAFAPGLNVQVYAEAGAPEGALYLDGELVGYLPGVTRLS